MSQNRRCPHCGAGVTGNGPTCPACGVPFAAMKASPPRSQPHPLAGGGREARLAARAAEPPKVPGIHNAAWADAMWRLAIREFNSGQFFACHETLEELWKADNAPNRAVYQGILQIGVAFHHIRVTRNWRGAVRMLMSGLAFIEPYLAAPESWPLPLRSLPPDLARLHADASRALAALKDFNPDADYAALAARLGRAASAAPQVAPDRLAREFPATLVPALHLQSDSL